MKSSHLRLALAVLLAAALLVRFERELLAPIFHSDQLRFLVGAQSILEGEGFALSYADPLDVSRSIPKPYPAGAVGYPRLLAIGLWLTGSDYWGSVLLNLLGVLALLGGWWMLWKAQAESLDPAAPLALLLFFGFSGSPYFLYSSTDLLALGAMWLAFGLARRSLAADGRMGWRALGLSALLAYLAFDMRFAYYPLVWMLPLSLLAPAWLGGARGARWQPALMLGLMAGAVALSWSLARMPMSFMDEAAEVGEARGGLRWENLLLFNWAFPMEALTDGRWVHSVFSRLGLPAAAVVMAQAALSLLVASVAGWGLWRVARRAGQGRDARHWFDLLFPLLLAGANVGSLLLLSLTKEPEQGGPSGFFTYVAEGRYFAPAHAATLYFFLWAVFERRPDQATGWLAKAPRSFAFGLALLGMLYWPVAKWAEARSTPAYAMMGQDKVWIANLAGDERFSRWLADEIQASWVDGVRPLYVCHDRTSFVAEAMGAEFGGSVKNRLDSLATSRPVQVFVAIDQLDPSAYLLDYCRRRGLSPAYDQGNFLVYKFLLNP